MVTDLKEAFHLDNLRRAWRWLNTNPDALYKNYFRHIYRAYAISAESNLDELHKRLVKGTFQPTHATKLYFPKKSGIQRTYTLLTVEDQIVYQALANVVAERLLPKVGKRYYKEVFGNLYAGQRSVFFYRDWRKGYKIFGDAIRKVYTQGFEYSASFDLTACYDSIDHSVLSYFLLDLGLQKEFVELLCDHLKLWTAALIEKRIYQGHGIPQGPLSSGLLSEVVLRYFDENRTEKPRYWRYFRYVDDIRFFAKNEHDLRSMLVEMDLLSKQIGLFPQSSKVDIHRVDDVEKEIKSVSHPPEPVTTKTSPNQPQVRGRLKELSPRYEVENETRFKYVLGSAEPSAELSNRLIQILRGQPHLYASVFQYFSRYTQISKAVSDNLLDLLNENSLYAAFTAAGLRALQGRCHPDIQPRLEKFAKDIIRDPKVAANPELRAAAVATLLANNRMSWKDTHDYVIQEQDWWPRTELVRHVQIGHIGQPSYEFLINQLLTDPSVDVSIVATELIVVHSLNVVSPTDKINPVAQLTLKELGMIRARRGGLCPISCAMQAMLGLSVKDIDWKKLLGTHYQPTIPNAIRLRAYSETDATAWVNLLDTIHDDLLNSLFAHEAGAIGNYAHGKPGGTLASPTSRFAQKFPKAHKAFSCVHQKRLESSLSHAVVRTTGKRTRFIEHEYIDKIKPQLQKAYLEIWGKWV